MPDLSVRRVLSVAWREFRYTALTKGFIIAAIGVPLLMVAVLAVVPAAMVSQFKPLEGSLAVVGGTESFARAIQASLDREAPSFEDPLADLVDGLGVDQRFLEEAQAGLKPSVSVEILPADTDVDRLREEVRSGTHLGFLTAPSTDPPETGTRQEVELFTAPDLSPRNSDVLGDIVAEAVVRERLSTLGEDYDRQRSLLRWPRMELRRLGQAAGEQGGTSKAQMLVPFVLMMLLWTAAFTGGNYLLTSTIEEKSNKVMEVLLSAVGPLELLWGKIIGLGGVALVILVMYGGLAVAGLFAFAMTDVLSLGMLLWSTYFFFVAYLSIAALMAAIGSAVNDLREAQTLMGPAMIVLILPMLLWMPISENPNGSLAVVASFIPPIVPFTMIMRLGATGDPVPLTQIVAAAVLGAASVVMLVWAASRIFRVGVLMQGKVPNPFELLRWIRQS